MHIERHDDRLLLSDVTPFEWLLGLMVPALLVGTGWTLIPAAGNGEFRLDWGALGFLATVAALLVLRRPRQTEIDRAARTLAITTSPFLPVRRTRIIPFEQVARVSVWQLASRGDLGFCRPLLVLKSGATTGAMDLKTKIAIMQFQESVGGPSTGALTVQQLQTLFVRAAGQMATGQ